MSYGLHRTDRAWQGNPELPDEPGTNELIESPPDGWLDGEIEDRLSQYDPGTDVYAGTDNSDSGFYSDDEPY